MASDTDIANVALRLLKAQKIVFSDGSKNANVVDDVFEDTREDLLRSHNWNFATKRVKLTAGGTAPTFEFDNAFLFPADWLRTVSVHDNDAGAGALLYRHEEVNSVGSIITSADEVWMRYIYDLSTSTLMPADFRMAFSYALAVAMPGISNLSASREDLLERSATRVLRRAKHADAVGSSPESRPAGSWVTVRGGYPGWRAWPD